jgi:hypothetical protein
MEILKCGCVAGIGLTALAAMGARSYPSRCATSRSRSVSLILNSFASIQRHRRDATSREGPRCSARDRPGNRNDRNVIRID